MTSRIAAVIVSLLLFSSSALAKWSKPPAQACQLLAYLPGMWTGPYRYMETVGWTCLTSYYVLHPASIDAPNNLAYYVDGTAEQAMELKLVLNVYVKYPRETTAALTTLARYTAELTRKALGQPLPVAATARVQQGRAGEWQLGAAIVQTRRKDWPTQKGYTLYVHLK